MLTLKRIVISIWRTGAKLVANLADVHVAQVLYCIRRTCKSGNHRHGKLELIKIFVE